MDEKIWNGICSLRDELNNLDSKVTDVIKQIGDELAELHLGVPVALMNNGLHPVVWYQKFKGKWRLVIHLADEDPIAIEECNRQLRAEFIANLDDEWPQRVHAQLFDLIAQRRMILGRKVADGTEASNRGHRAQEAHSRRQD